MLRIPESLIRPAIQISDLLFTGYKNPVKDILSPQERNQVNQPIKVYRGEIIRVETPEEMERLEILKEQRLVKLAETSYMRALTDPNRQPLIDALLATRMERQAKFLTQVLEIDSSVTAAAIKQGQVAAQELQRASTNNILSTLGQKEVGELLLSGRRAEDIVAVAINTQFRLLLQQMTSQPEAGN